MHLPEPAQGENARPGLPGGQLELNPPADVKEPTSTSEMPGRRVYSLASGNIDVRGGVLRFVTARFRHFRRPGSLPRHQLELACPITIRTSREDDRPALERLAELDGRTLTGESFLVAEVAGALVAATPLDTELEPISDPFRPTRNVRELLNVQARHLRQD